MAFVKLDCGILDSSLWPEIVQRNVFLTALLMALPHVLDKPAEQIEIGSLKKTGFKVPPGIYGFVPASGPGIVRRAGVDLAEGMAALKALGEPDPDSRSKDFDGRRLVRVDGGFLVLNYYHYREHDYTNAERQARYRERHRNNGVTQRNVTGSNAVTGRYITHADADADAEGASPTPPEGAAAGSGSAHAEKIAPELLRLWNSHTGLIPVADMGGGRIGMLRARCRSAFFLAHWLTALERVGRSPFCTGQGPRSWKADLDWFLRPDTVTRVMEGKYDGLKSAAVRSSLPRPQPRMPSIEEINRAQGIAPVSEKAPTKRKTKKSRRTQ